MIIISHINNIVTRNIYVIGYDIIIITWSCLRKKGIDIEIINTHMSNKNIVPTWTLSVGPYR